MTVAVVRVTRHLVTVFVLAAGGVLITLAVADNVDPKTTVALRWVAAMWLATTAVALWEVRHHPGNILRLPLPLVWPFLARLCWGASG